MDSEDIADAEETVEILIAAELEVQHRLEGHGHMVPSCPLCRQRTRALAQLVRR